MNNCTSKHVAKIVVLIFVLIISSNFSFGQKNIDKKSSRFLILIETTKEGLKLTSKKGCKWKELTFSIKQDTVQAIDQFGMTSLDKRSSEDNGNHTSFLFTIKKTKDGISLLGKHGTAWTNLTFNCPNGKCYQYIDFSGMTDKK